MARSAEDALARLRELVESPRAAVAPLEVARVAHRINWSGTLVIVLAVMALASPFITYLAGQRAGRQAATAKFERQVAQAREQQQAAEARSVQAVAASEAEFRERLAVMRSAFNTTNEALRRELTLLDARLAACRVPDSVVRHQNAARRAANAAAAGVAVESLLGVAPAARGSGRVDGRRGAGGTGGD